MIHVGRPLDQIERRLVVAPRHFGPREAFSQVLRLLELEDVGVEELLQLLVRVVDEQLSWRASGSTSGSCAWIHEHIHGHGRARARTRVHARVFRPIKPGSEDVQYDTCYRSVRSAE